MNLWGIMLVGGLITYLTRLSFIALFGKIEVSPTVQCLLRYVPPAVLSAIIFPELLLHTGSLNVSLGNTRLLAGLVAILVAWRTRSALLTILFGMAALILINLIHM